MKTVKEKRKDFWILTFLWYIHIIRLCICVNYLSLNNKLFQNLVACDINHSLPHSFWRSAIGMAWLAASGSGSLSGAVEILWGPHHLKSWLWLEDSILGWHALFGWWLEALLSQNVGPAIGLLTTCRLTPPRVSDSGENEWGKKPQCLLWPRPRNSITSAFFFFFSLEVSH